MGRTGSPDQSQDSLCYFSHSQLTALHHLLPSAFPQDFAWCQCCLHWERLSHSVLMLLVTFNPQIFSALALRSSLSADACFSPCPFCFTPSCIFSSQGQQVFSSFPALRAVSSTLPQFWAKAVEISWSQIIIFTAVVPMLPG